MPSSFWRSLHTRRAPAMSGAAGEVRAARGTKDLTQRRAQARSREAAVAERPLQHLAEVRLAALGGLRRRAIRRAVPGDSVAERVSVGAVGRVEPAAVEHRPGLWCARAAVCAVARQAAGAVLGPHTAVVAVAIARERTPLRAARCLSGGASVDRRVRLRAAIVVRLPVLRVPVCVERSCRAAGPAAGREQRGGVGRSRNWTGAPTRT